MLQNMMNYTTFLLGALSDFLMSEPICYLVGIIIITYIFRCIMSLRA